VLQLPHLKNRVAGQREADQPILSCRAANDTRRGKTHSVSRCRLPAEDRYYSIATKIVESRVSCLVSRVSRLASLRISHLSYLIIRRETGGRVDSIVSGMTSFFLAEPASDGDAILSLMT
jgi:hypothetical protein